MLKKSDLICDDGKRPNVMSLTPKENSLYMDATCVDTLSNSHLKDSSKNAGAAANNASITKERKYSNLITNHHFVVFAVDTLGPFSESMKSFVKILGNSLNTKSEDKR